MRCRRRDLAFGLTILLFMGSIGMPADAGWFGRTKKKPAPESLRRRPKRFEIAAPLCFEAGRLGRSAGGQWALGNVPLYVSERTTVRRLDEPDAPASLADGAEVYVMGKRSGGVLVCNTVLIVPYVSLSTATWPSQESVQWSDSDPTVGVGRGPN
jgi:hypothetical protein